jgi:hypothetical protein
MVFTAAASTATAQSWYDTDWSHRKKITIDNTKVSTVDSTNLTNFPVLINRTDADWKDAANSGRVAQSDGGDILFTSSNGTTKLDHEIEFYDETTGELIAWVEVPTVTAATDTDIFVYYGNSTGVADQWNVNGTWTGSFAGVWHLKETPDGTSGELKDSTSNTNHGTTEGAMNSADSLDAKIGKGLDFDEIDDRVRVPDSTSLDATNDEATISMWIWVEDGADGDHQIIMTSSNRFATGANDGYELSWQGNGNHFFYPWGGNNSNYNLGLNPIADQTWQHVAVTFKYSTSEASVYVNGSPMTFTTTNVPTYWTTLASPEDWLWGGNPDRATRYFDGMFDEIRVSDTARPRDWIVTSFNNQGSPSAFYAIWAEAQSIPDAPSAVGPTHRVDGSARIDKQPALQFTQSDPNVADTLSLQIQIDDSSDFSSPVVDYTSTSIAQGATSFTVGQAEGLGSYATGSAGQTLVRSKYYWRVRSNDGTVDGAWATANGGAVAFYIGLPTAGVCP